MRLRAWWFGLAVLAAVGCSGAPELGRTAGAVLSCSCPPTGTPCQGTPWCDASGTCNYPPAQAGTSCPLDGGGDGVCDGVAAGAGDCVPSSFCSCAPAAGECTQSVCNLFGDPPCQLDPAPPGEPCGGGVCDGVHVGALGCVPGSGGGPRDAGGGGFDFATPPRDFSVPHDFSVARDFSSPEDFASAPDLSTATAPDLSTADSSSPADFSSLPDLAPPPDLSQQPPEPWIMLGDRDGCTLPDQGGLFYYAIDDYPDNYQPPPDPNLGATEASDQSPAPSSANISLIGDAAAFWSFAAHGSDDDLTKQVYFVTDGDDNLTCLFILVPACDPVGPGARKFTQVTGYAAPPACDRSAP